MTTTPEMKEQALKLAERKLASLVENGLLLSRTRDRDVLLRNILLGGRDIANCAAATLFLKSSRDTLIFAMRTNDCELPSCDLPLFDSDGTPNEHYVVTHAVTHNETVIIDDVYSDTRFDFSGTKAFSEDSGFRTVSMLTVPLSPRPGEVLGALQLMNALDEITGEVTPFPPHLIGFIEAMASQSAVALENQSLLQNAISTLEDVERMARHDLKTPLASLAAAPSLLRAGRAMSEQEERILCMMENAANRALGMVNLTMDMYRMETGSYTFVGVAVDLSAIVRSVVQHLRNHSESKRVLIVIENFERPVLANGDESLCYSIVANLLKNAVEAAPEGSSVLVSLTGDGSASVRIHNEGVVPKFLRERFFEKYSTGGKAGGTGLGTYSSRLLAEAQSGTLTMSTSEVLGTSLTLELAVSNSAPGAQLGHRSTNEPRTPHAFDNLPRRILVIDDDDFNRLIVGDQLEQQGFEVETAINGKFGCEASMLRRADVILMDIEMPVMGGIEAMQQVREFQSSQGQIPSLIVAYSGNDDAESQERYMGLGFDKCLQKPSSLQLMRAFFASIARQDESGSTVVID